MEQNRKVPCWHIVIAIIIMLLMSVLDVGCWCYLCIIMSLWRRKWHDSSEHDILVHRSLEINSSVIEHDIVWWCRSIAS